MKRNKEDKTKIRKLHLGCGRNIKEGFINADIKKLPAVDVVFDMEKFPYPFEDNYFEEVLCENILEHINDLIGVMEELYRICRNDAVVKINVPHFTSYGAFVDPTHKRFFTYETMDYFSKDYNINWYSNANFTVVKRKINFGKKFQLWNYPIEWLANCFPKFYEQTVFKSWPAGSITYIIKAKK